MKNGFFPPENVALERAEALLTASSDESWWSKVLGPLLLCAGLLGPLVIGIGLPAVVALLFHPHRAALAILPVFILPLAGYVVMFGVIGGGLGGNYGVARGLAAVPVVVDIGSSADGELVMVSGRVVADTEERVNGELTGKEFVWTELELNVTAPSGRGRDTRVSRESSQSAPFAVAPEGAPAIPLDSTGGLLRAAPQQTTVDGVGAPGGHRLRALLELENLELQSHEDADVSERSLAVGDQVLVLAVVRHGAAYRGEGCLASGPDDRLMVSGEKRHELLAAFGPSKGSRITVIVGVVGVVIGLLLMLGAQVP